MFTKFSRSWSLIKASGSVLRQDKELLVFPMLAVGATLLVILSFAAPLIVTGALGSTESAGGPQPLVVVTAFLFYLTQYFIVVFFSAALVGAAMVRLDGGAPTVGDGLRIAASKALPILVSRGIGPIDAVKESAQLLKQSWGENIIGVTRRVFGGELMDSAFRSKS